MEVGDSGDRLMAVRGVRHVAPLEPHRQPCRREVRLELPPTRLLPPGGHHRDPAAL